MLVGVPLRSEDSEGFLVVEGKEEAEVCLFNWPKLLPFVGGRTEKVEVIMPFEINQIRRA